MKPAPQTTDTVIAIGTSTGGTQALEAVLYALPRGAPEQRVRNRGARSAPGRPRDTRARADRAWRQAHAVKAQRRALSGRCGGWPGGQPAPPLGRRTVPLGG